MIHIRIGVYITQTKRHRHGLELAAFFARGARPVGDGPVAGAVDYTLGEHGMTAGDTFKEHTAHDTVFHDGIDAESVQDAPRPRLFDHLVGDELHDLGIGVLNPTFVIVGTAERSRTR